MDLSTIRQRPWEIFGELNVLISDMDLMLYDTTATRR